MVIIMKKIFLILFVAFTFFSTIFIVHADSNNDYISIDTFTSTLEQKGYKISNYSDNVYANKGDITFKYIYFNNENNAKVELEELCKVIDSNNPSYFTRVNCPSNTVGHNGYFSVIYDNDNYVTAGRKNNIIILATGNKKNKEEIDKIMKEFDYYYEEPFFIMFIVAIVFGLIWLIGAIIAIILATSNRKRLEKNNNINSYQTIPNNYNHF